MWKGGKGKRKIELIIFFLWLWWKRFSRDGEDTKFEVELFFFPPWKKVVGGVVIVDVVENKGLTSEFRTAEVSLSRIESV